MLQNAKYSVWFRTPQGEGYGIVSLMDGNVSGGDNVSTYTGAYVQDGDEFSATTAVRRHTQGQPSVFGIDNEARSGPNHGFARPPFTRLRVVATSNVGSTESVDASKRAPVAPMLAHPPSAAAPD
jgi:hypothetical protein